MRVAAMFVIAACSAAKPTATVEPAFDDPYEFMPADTQGVVTIDMPAVRRSPLWHKYGRAALEAFAPRFAKCGYDVLDAMTTIVQAAPPPGSNSTVVVRGVDRERAMKCFAEPDEDSTTTRDGDIITWRHKSGTMNMVTFANTHTLVMLGKHPTKEALTQLLTIGAPLRRNANLMAQAKQVEPGAAIAFVFGPSETLTQLLQGRFDVAARSLVISVRVRDDGFAWSGRIGVASAQDASDAAARLTPSLQAFGGMLERMDLHADGDALVFDGAITQAQLDAIIEFVRQQASRSGAGTR